MRFVNIFLTFKLPHFYSCEYLFYMQPIEQLIQKFWAGQTSEDENQFLLKLLEEQENASVDSRQAEFFQLRDKGTILVDPEKAAGMLAHIHARIDNSRQSAPAGSGKVISLAQKKIWWAAASVILLAGLGILFISRRPERIQVAENHPGITKPALKTITNNTDTSRIVKMQDGSVVTLSSSSALSYYESFNDTSRDISLTGEAMFTVAKDAKRPFTVYTNGIATTALGTIFTVNGLSPDTTSVILFEGRVVIRAIDSAGRSDIGQVFLSPGQQFTVSKTTSRYLVKNIPVNKNQTRDIAGTTQKHDAGNAVRLSFDHEPLATVFRQLTRTYKIDIRFDSKDIAGLYFSGTVLKNDSFQTVMSAICNMNQLLFTEEQSYIQVKKSN